MTEAQRERLWELAEIGVDDPDALSPEELAELVKLTLLNNHAIN